MNDQPRPTTLGGLKTLIRRRMPGVPRSALWAAYSVMGSTPVERCPAPLARLLGIMVPRSGPPGCNLAIDEFLADKPERPIEIEIDNFQKWYIQKS